MLSNVGLFRRMAKAQDEMARAVMTQTADASDDAPEMSVWFCREDSTPKRTPGFHTLADARIGRPRSYEAAAALQAIANRIQ